MIIVGSEERWIPMKYSKCSSKVEWEVVAVCHLDSQVVAPEEVATVIATVMVEDMEDPSSHIHTDDSISTPPFKGHSLIYLLLLNLLNI